MIELTDVKVESETVGDPIVLFATALEALDFPDDFDFILSVSGDNDEEEWFAQENEKGEIILLRFVPLSQIYQPYVLQDDAFYEAYESYKENGYVTVSYRGMVHTFSRKQAKEDGGFLPL